MWDRVLSEDEPLGPSKGLYICIHIYVHIYICICIYICVYMALSINSLFVGVHFIRGQLIWVCIIGPLISGKLPYLYLPNVTAFRCSSRCPCSFKFLSLTCGCPIQCPLRLMALHLGTRQADVNEDDHAQREREREMCVFVCMYVYIYICTYIYAYIHIDRYIDR